MSEDALIALLDQRAHALAVVEHLMITHPEHAYLLSLAYSRILAYDTGLTSTIYGTAVDLEALSV